MNAETLEWAAQWIEDSLKGETNKRVIEFGRNMAMTLRAATQPENDRQTSTEESPSPASLACTECPYVFTEAEIAAEDKNAWGHPCPRDKQPGMGCESYRATVPSQES